MFSRLKFKIQSKVFPIDFYGEESSWRFAIRAECREELIDAMYWCAHIACHRKDFDLLHISSAKFNCRYNASAIEASDLQLDCRVKMMGPIVRVVTLREHLKVSE